MRPCLEKKHLGDESFEYNPGFIDIHENFYQCPLDIIYVQLLYVVETSTYTERRIKAKLNIFNKDLKSSKLVVWTKTTKKYGTGTVNIMQINSLLNFINSYIHEDYDFDLLTENKINNAQLSNSRYKSSYRHIIDDINLLQISYSEHAHPRVGKDDAFWKEIAIKNLPSTNYFRNLIIQILGKHTNLGNIVITDNLLRASYDYYTSIGNGNRGKMGPYTSDTLEYYIKDSIKAHILTDFNYDRENLELFYLELLNN